MRLLSISILLFSLVFALSIHAESGSSFFELNEDEIQHEKRQLDLLELTVQTNLSFRFFPAKIPYYIKQFQIQGLTETEEYLYFQALNFYNKKLKSESLLHATKSIEINPSYPPSLNLIGVIYTEAGRLSDATSFFKRSVAESPWDPTFNYNYANNLYRLGRSSDALTYAENAIELKSNVRDASYLKGLILIELKKNKEAADAFELAKLNGLNTEQFYKIYMKVVLSIGDELKSIELLPYIEKYRDLESRRMTVEVRMKMGEHARAARILASYVFTDQAVLKDKENYVIAIFRMKGKFDDLEKLTDDESEKLHLARVIENLSMPAGPAGPVIRDPILNPLN